MPSDRRDFRKKTEAGEKSLNWAMRNAITHKRMRTLAASLPVYRTKEKLEREGGGGWGGGWEGGGGSGGRVKHDMLLPKTALIGILLEGREESIQGRPSSSLQQDERDGGRRSLFYGWPVARFLNQKNSDTCHRK